MKKKNIWMKILAFLALFGILISVVAVWIMSFMTPTTQKAPTTQQNSGLKVDYVNIKATDWNKIKVGDIKVNTKKVETPAKKTAEEK